jgi:hypothetical protein
MPVLNRFAPYSDTWHVVDSDVKNTMHSVAVHAKDMCSVVYSAETCLSRAYTKHDFLQQWKNHYLMPIYEKRIFFHLYVAK